MARTAGTNDEFSTDPAGNIARYERNANTTDVSGGVSIGGVGMPVRTMTGQTLGRGVGATYSMPIGGARKAKGGKVKKMAKGGSAASKRADGCCTKGKTKGKFV